MRVRLGEAPLAAQAEPAPAPETPTEEEKLGIAVQELTPELLPRTAFSEPGGVIITDVTRLGPASRRGIGPGAKILAINNEPIQTPADVRRVLRSVDSGQVVSLLLGAADGTTRVVNVRAGG